MHSYYNKLLPNHVDDYFIAISSIQSRSTRIFIYNNLIFPRANSSSEQSSFTFVGSEVVSPIPDSVKSSAILLAKGNLRNVY